MRQLNFSGEEILETITMVRTEQLDIRTITVGISLLDCVSENPDTLCRNVYEKIERTARNLRRVSAELSEEFGAQAVILAIDAKRSGDHWEVMVRGGRDITGLDAIDWAKRGVSLGAGEILLTSVDRDGTQQGFDVPLTSKISRAVSVPVIASGGAKLPEHFAEIFMDGAADAALAASIFHDNIQPIRELKQFLAARGIEVRLPC